VKNLIFILFLVFLGFAITANSYAQDDKKNIRKGNKLYSDGKYEDAEMRYRQALDENSNSFEGAFNLGDAAYKQEKYEDAATQFDLLTKQLADNDKIAKSYHNLGNSYLKSKDYGKSVEAFKNALRNNPADLDTKYNLAYAQQKLKEQQQEQKNEDKENKEDQKENQDQKKDQEKKDQQKKQQDKQEDQKQEEKQEQQPKKKTR